MLTIGDKFPEFNLTAVKAGINEDHNSAFTNVNNETYRNKWLVVFFWPKDFTFVCPTEIAKFGKLYDKFQSEDTDVLGISTDSEFVHLAWKKQTNELSDLPFKIAADLGAVLSKELGIFSNTDLIANRATFIVDNTGTIRFVSVIDILVGRNPEEIYRSLAAIRTGGFCHCDWQPGQDNMN